MFKKLFSLFLVNLLLFAPALCAAQGEIEVSQTKNRILRTEHLPRYEKQNSPSNRVKIAQYSNLVEKSNIVPVVFVENFNSKYYKEGDLVEFRFNQDIKTKEGTLVIPCGSSLIARVDCLIKPKWFSRNARLGLKFQEIVFPDGTITCLNGVTNTKNNELKMGAWATVGKILGYTVLIGGVGTGLGAAIGVAGGNVISGVIIGGSIGGGVGLATGIVSPGLHYRAKKDSLLYVRLVEDANLPKVR